LDLSWLRQTIGVVMQEPVLFAGTIRSNIALAKPDATEVSARIPVHVVFILVSNVHCRRRLWRRPRKRMRTVRSCLLHGTR
jgi:ABC-type multidrug transport system fused ATPase/permease subunit